MASLKPFQIRCASEDKYRTPVIASFVTYKEADDNLKEYARETHTALSRLGIFNTLTGCWADMPRILSK